MTILNAFMGSAVIGGLFIAGFVLVALTAVAYAAARAVIMAFGLLIALAVKLGWLQINERTGDIA